MTSYPALKYIGDALREHRHNRGEDLYAIADFLRIRPSYLLAIEEGDLASLPGRIYALGFIRSYSDYLGFDGDEIVRRVKVAIDGNQPEIVVKRRSPLSEVRRPVGMFAAAALSLALAIYGGWYTFFRDGPVIERVGSIPGELGRFSSGVFDLADDRDRTGDPTPPSQAAPAGGPSGADEAERKVAIMDASAPLRPAESGADDASRRSAQDTIDDAPARGNGRQPSSYDAASAVAAETTIAQLNAPRIEVDRDVPVSTGSQLENETGESGIARAQEGRVVLIATQNSWIQVRSEGRDYVRTRTLEPGQRFSLPDRSDLALWTGNAGGLDVYVDGRSLGQLGPSGQVLRNVGLEPRALVQLLAD